MMERLTGKDELGYYFPLDIKMDCLKRRGKDVDRLGAYEDTGMTPEEVTAAKMALMGKSVAEIKEFDGLTINRLCELAKADKDGRLLVLPCKVGDTIWFVLQDFPQFYPETAGWYIWKSRVRTVADKGFSDGEDDFEYASWDELGKTVFLTREEAEDALKERVKDGSLHRQSGVCW